ncbi:hypothetical protein G9A89_016479 [Geosiphon pyriformis]|nr:hypothetical protein G9A89_016479 [Geosiphon pyriformis]
MEFSEHGEQKYFEEPIEHTSNFPATTQPIQNTPQLMPTAYPLSSLQHQFIRFNVETVEIQSIPTLFSSTNEKKMVLSFRFANNDCQWALTTGDDIIIPLPSIMGFKINQHKKIQIRIANGVKLKCRKHNPSGLSTNPCPVEVSLQNVTSLLFTPCDNVEDNTLVLLGIGMKTIRFADKNQTEKKSASKAQSASVDVTRTTLNANSTNLKTENQTNTETNNELLVSQRPLGPQMNITCTFMIKKINFLVPKTVKYNELLATIEQKSKIELDPNRVSFINAIGQKVTLTDEEDWKVCKWEFDMEKMLKLEIYLF